jgi:hypothetical protein
MTRLRRACAPATDAQQRVLSASRAAAGQAVASRLSGGSALRRRDAARGRTGCCFRLLAVVLHRRSASRSRYRLRPDSGTAAVISCTAARSCFRLRKRTSPRSGIGRSQRTSRERGLRRAGYGRFRSAKRGRGVAGARRLNVVRCGRAGPGRGRARSHLNAGAAECPLDARDRAFHRAGLTGHLPIAQARAPRLRRPRPSQPADTRAHASPQRARAAGTGPWPIPGSNLGTIRMLSAPLWGRPCAEPGRPCADTPRSGLITPRRVLHPRLPRAWTRPGARGPAPDGALRLDRGPPDHGHERDPGPSMTSWPSRSISDTGSSISPRKPASGSKQRKASR